MPLTLPTHPIAVVPLKLRWPQRFDGVALAAGAIAPDLAYAAHGIGVTIRTHNLPALVWWGLPVTLVVTYLVRWAAPMVAAHLPGGGPLRLRDYGVLGSVRHRRHITVLSALLGAFSHLVWDAITHPGYVSLVRHEVWPGTPWWGLLSDASNIVGFVVATVLMVWIGRAGLLRRWHGPPAPVTARPVAFWSAVAPAFAAGMTLLAAHPTQWFAAQAIRAMLIAGLALMAGAAAARGATVRSRDRPAPPRPGRTAG